MRFRIWARNYERDVEWTTDPHSQYRTRETRSKDYDYPDDEKWVVESIDSGAEFYYASHEDAINSIYEGSK